MNPIEPAEISTSFRRICERDFSDVVDKYHTPEQRRNSQGTEQYAAAVRTNDTLDHLADETRLHSVNLMSAAYYLEQFICSLIRVLKWEPLLKAFKQENNLDMRQGFAILFAQNLLGVLDFAQDPINHSFRNVPVLTALAPNLNLIHGTAGWLEMFFQGIPTSNVLWFQAEAASDDTNVEIIGSRVNR